MKNKMVITAGGVDLPFGEDRAIWERMHNPVFEELNQTTWHFPMLESKITELTGTPIKFAFMPRQDTSKSRVSLKRRSSSRLYENLRGTIGKAGIEIKKERQALRIGIAESLSYLFFSNDETVNLFNFKTNLESQTPAPVGDWLGCTGPQFIVKEGDSSDLICVDMMASALELMPGPLLICGISEPQPMLTCIELIAECSAVKKSKQEDEKIKINTRFTEGAASILVETPRSADKRGCQPLAQISGSYNCIRGFDYQNPEEIEHHVERCLEKMLKFSSGNIRAVFGCFRRNERIREIEWKLLRRLLPEARIIDTTSYLGDVSPISGLIDLVFAANGFQYNKLPGGIDTLDATKNGPVKETPLSLRGGEILVHKISRFGHYAGILLSSGV